MNDTTHEQLSALLDGELPRDELRFLLRRLDNDAELARRWSRYQIASAVLKREYASPQAGPGFAAGVMARLDAAPARRSSFGVRALRWVGGGAIAASVAIVGLVAVRPPATDRDPAVSGASVAAAAPAPTAPAPVGELRQPLLQQQLMPFADYAQPASYESIVPNYGVPSRNSYGAPFSGTAEGTVPYVLIVGARQADPAQPVPSAVRQDAQPKP